MELGKYPRYAVVTLCGLLLFFLGFTAFHTFNTAFVSILVIVLLTVGISYINRNPLGGSVLGICTSTAFLLGFFLNGSIRYAFSRGPLYFLEQMLGFGGFGHVRWGLLSAVFAMASVGLFFGTLGYVFGHISLRASVTQPRLFRDYWSSVHLLGKSGKREYVDLDRKLSSWSFKKKGWWRRLVEKITEPQPDLVFSHRTKKSSSELGRGDLFDLSSGQMIGQDIIDPFDLTSRYRPFVLKVAEIWSGSKGVRRIAFEKLTARFLEWFMPSRIIWIVYSSLSISLICSACLYARKHARYFGGVEWSVAVAATITSGALFFFVWRWRKVSRELFERRQDERILIFFVYVILAILYVFFFAVITHPPDISLSLPFIPQGWIGSWSIWTGCFLVLTVLLGFGYICIHRESEVANAYFYDNSPRKSDVSQLSPFKESHDAPFWLEEEKVKAYWVLRFMYFWRYELTAIPHPDWERVEVWIDAENGIVKWVVSDYHYRELWYKVEGDLPILYVKFFTNFHTPVPVVDSAEIESISSVFRQTTGDLIRIAASEKAAEIIENLRTRLEALPKPWMDLHPAEWIRGYGLSKVAARFCSKLPWTYWRYPHGLEKVERYLGRPAVQLEDQPVLGK